MLIFQGVQWDPSNVICWGKRNILFVGSFTTSCFFFPQKMGERLSWRRHPEHLGNMVYSDAGNPVSSDMSLGKFQMCRLGSTMKINLSGKRFIHLQRCARWGRWRCNCEDHLTKRVLWMAVVSQWHSEPCVWWIVKFLWCGFKKWKRYRNGKHFPIWLHCTVTKCLILFHIIWIQFQMFSYLVKPLSSEIRSIGMAFLQWNEWNNRKSCMFSSTQKCSPLWHSWTAYGCLALLSLAALAQGFPLDLVSTTSLSTSARASHLIA